MLSIGKLSAGMEQYYERSVARGADDYYSGAGESAGEWRGRGAEALHLTGQVRDGQLTALMAGRNPESGEQLRERTSNDKVGALDLTFSAPKSVSVLFAVADERTSAALVGCHEDAVRAALSYVEDTAAVVRRGKDGHQRLPASGLIVGSFRHRMSRARDPQLHTHNVVANFAQGPDGRYTALHGAELYRAGKTAGFVYQAHLRALVTERLGLEWGPVRKGAAELAAIDAPVLTEFSRRKAEIQEAAKEAHVELGGPAAGNYAVRVTREAKQEVSTVDWRAGVRARAAEHGLDLGKVSVAERSRGGLEDLTLALGDRLAGSEGLTHMSNTFDERAVVRAYAEAAGQGATVEQVREQAREFLDRPDVLARAGGRWTTQALVDAERARESAQLGRADTRTAVMSEKAVRDGARGLGLNDEQRGVVEAVARSGNGVDLVQAQAGTGKTYTMNAVRRVAELDGRRVIGCAPTARAARELHDQGGIDSHTLDSLVRRLDRGDLELGRRDVVIMDETGMAGTRLAARLERHAQDAGAKVIEIGDRRQLQSVLAGGELAGAHKALGGLELTGVVRQNDLGERRILGRLHAGDVRAYAEHQDKAGRVHRHAELEQAVSMFMGHARELKGFDKVALLCKTNAMVTAANDQVREQLGHTRPWEVGDRVLCRLNDRHLQVVNGDRGTIARVHGVGVDVELDSGVKRSIPRSYIDGGFLQHGWAQTIHTSQGMTVDRTVVATRPDELKAELGYVAATRARDTTDVFLIDGARENERAEIGPVGPELERDQLEVLIRAMGESQAEDLAIDQQLGRDLGLGLER